MDSGSFILDWLQLGSFIKWLWRGEDKNAVMARIFLPFNLTRYGKGSVPYWHQLDDYLVYQDS